MRLSSNDRTKLALAYLGLPAAQGALMTHSHRSAGSSHDHFITLRQNGQCVGVGANAAGTLDTALASCQSNLATQRWRLTNHKLQHVVQTCLGTQSAVAGAALSLVACNAPSALNFTQDAAGALTTNNGALCLNVAALGLSLQPCASGSPALTASNVAPSAQVQTSMPTTGASSPIATNTPGLTQATADASDVVVTVTETVYTSETTTVGPFSTVTVTAGELPQNTPTPTPTSAAASSSTPASEASASTSATSSMTPMTSSSFATSILTPTPTSTLISISTPLSLSVSTGSTSVPTPTSSFSTSALPVVPTTSATPTTASSTTLTTFAAAPSPSVYNPVCSGLGAWPLSSAMFEAEVLRLINLQRGLQTTCGTTVMPPVPPLVADDAITCVSRAFAQDMSTYNYFSHTDRAGNSPFTRLSNAGVPFYAAAENIAVGQTTPSQVVSAWVNSPGHCTDLMTDYTRTGVGFVNNYWVQDFTSS